MQSWMLVKLFLKLTKIKVKDEIGKYVKLIVVIQFKTNRTLRQKTRKQFKLNIEMIFF